LAETVDGTQLRVVRRCLDAEDLLSSVQAGELDAAIVSAYLHGFDIDALRALARVRIPLVLWGVNNGSAPEGLDASRVTVLPRDVELAELGNAVRGLAPGGGRLGRRAGSPGVHAAEVERTMLSALAAPSPAPHAAPTSGT